ncbi:ATP-binding protein [Variovorax sp. WS11]|uniref:ATP-binding protein n=1 Tax=Variovorax sp. WS11 TaxID=1105204 RepID=UPI000D0E3311|nr:ATP-binding protein [Variovorax sp. WS11]NDZ17780.1 ATP-binding protein [Variovorax sp. WS11]PSL80039.1 ATP-binding protein [Variovorax sp. WS11]
MSENKEDALSDLVQISRQYQRSIRVDTDIGRLDALAGYICHATAASIVDGMCRQLSDTNQRSFTWTGPFGGGKSSLAVALASALHPDKALRTRARHALGLDSKPAFDRAFPVRKGWLLMSVVGRRGSVVADLGAAIRRAQGKSVDGRNKPNAQSVIAELIQEAKDRLQDGVLVILDEMGKFLEASALGSGDDVYFFQELAEAAARSDGRLVVVGVLHQSFAQYSARLGIDTRDDWAKVQGRYLDLPFVAASDEVVELIGRAIDAKRRPNWMIDASKVIADAIRSRRPAVGEAFAHSLAACWPLHPAMAALLGPISKRQFGQNERSTFGFLSSVEPHGFRSYLNSTPISQATWYRPSDYWDYLRANLEPAILASPDGHRWSQAVEAVERAEAKTGDPLLVSLIKNIAVIDLFRNGSGLAADAAVLGALFYDRSREELEAALQRLAALKVALYKSFTGAWSVFEGSDFDIDAAIAQALASSPGIDYGRLSQLMGLHPVVAKRHYHETGSMRWMELTLCSIEQAEKIANDYFPRRGDFGAFILALPSRGMSLREARKRAQACSKLRPWPVMVGIPSNHSRIAELSAELVALEHVKDRHELSGDAVARREVYARLAATRADLEDQLQAAVSLAKWHDGSDQIVEPGSKLSPVASELADDLFSSSPPVWSELVNRDSVSSNSVKARRDLLHAMVSAEGQEALGIEGFPAERGLYETLLRHTELYRQDASGAWRFLPPGDGKSEGFEDVWRATRNLFSDANTRIGADGIYSLWSAPPFGMKQGIQPVMLSAFMLAHKANIGVYKDGMFVPRLTDADIDECLQDPSRFSLRWVAIDEDKNRILEGIAKLLAEIGESAGAADPLEAARGLVAMVFNLPEWTRRTQRLGEAAKAMRDMLLKASDPHKVLFVDLASVLSAADGKAYVKALRAPLHELAGAYGKMLTMVEAKMLDALDAGRNDMDALRERAEAVAGVSGDLRMDAFATRLAGFDGSRESLEGILSLAAEKPPREWVDRHIDAAILELAKFARGFREAEAYVAVQGRKAHSEAIAVVIGTGSDTKTISRSFSIADRHRKTVEAKAEEIASMLEGQGLGTEVLLAILAKAGMKLASSDKELANG